ALDAFLHVALAGIGTFLFLKRLGRSISAAVLGGLFFALSGSELSQIYGGFYNFVEGIAWVPWAFWAAHKAVTQRRWSAWGLCGAAFALQILAGAAQLFTYTLVAVAFFALGEAWDVRKMGTDTRESDTSGIRTAPFWGLGLSLAFAGLLSAPQLWPTLRYLPLSARHGYSYAEFVGGSLRLSDLMNWVVPGFLGWQEPTYHGAVKDSFTCEYFGLLPLCLAGGALTALWRSNARIRRLALIAGVALCLALCRLRTFHDLLLHLPILSGFRIWSRTLFLLAFCGCSLGAFGWDALRARESRYAALKGAYLVVCLAGLAALVAWARADGRATADAGGMPWLIISTGSVRGATALLAALAKSSALRCLELLPFLAALLWLASRPQRYTAGLALVLAIAFHGCDQKPLYERFVRFTDPGHALVPTHFAADPPPPPGLEPWRVFDPDSANPNNATLLGYQNLYGDESVPLGAFASLRNAATFSPRRFSEFLDLMGARWIFRHSKLKSSEPGDRVTPLENVNAFPRAWLVGNWRTVAGDTQALNLLFTPSFNPRREAALSGNPHPKPSTGVPTGSVRWLWRSPQAFGLAINTDRAAALVVSNFWYPAWKVSVDGKEMPLLKADGALQAVAIPTGRHRVVFWFDESLFNEAMGACLAALLLLGGWLWLERKK
ncbi:MAG: hypothetical protein ACREKE_01365, partial [bacterium]